MVGTPVWWVVVRALVAWSVPGVEPWVRPAPGPRGSTRADCRAVSARTGGLVVVGTPVWWVVVRALVAWSVPGVEPRVRLAPRTPGGDEPTVVRYQPTGRDAGVWGGAPVVGRGG